MVSSSFDGLKVQQATQGQAPKVGYESHQAIDMWRSFAEKSQTAPQSRQVNYKRRQVSFVDHRRDGGQRDRAL
jgi:hypothetical protein